MEFNPKIPTTLLRMSMKYVFEPPSGIKATLVRTYQGNVNPQRSEKAPKERCKMHFLLSWFHAVIQERLRYTPIGWSKKYEFNETDQRASLDAVDEWITKATPEMSDNLDPKKIPWDAIRVLLGETIYGGKIDNKYNQKILNSLTEQLFTPKGFESSFTLFHVPKSSEIVPLVAPEGRRVADYKKWIDELPSIESPLWCGLPANVDDILKQRQVLHLIEGLKQLQGVEDEEAAGLDASAGSKRVKWMQKLEATITSLISLLPEALPSLPKEEKSLTDPLFRFLEREVLLGNKILKIVKKDLSDLKFMCIGELKITNELKEVQKELETDSIPNKWRHYKITNITATEWVIDFVKRLTQLRTLVPDLNYKTHNLWIGGFFFPEALATATRQSVVKIHGWSLEELDLVVQIGVSKLQDDQSFIIEGLCLEGYSSSQENQDLVSSASLSEKLHPITLRWTRIGKTDTKDISNSTQSLSISTASVSISSSLSKW